MTAKVREPAWLTSMVDQRLALMFEMMDVSMVTPDTILFTFLTEPAEDAKPIERAYWEHSCDNCGKYSRREVMTGTVNREFQGHHVVVQFGACRSCREAK